ncbi:DUF896 domain-containing protein [Terribacillus saccharophilus]|jgi:uncharacterized protein YnzC (UPF0291/DUF896 family)|uniref:UPF0291 protein CHH48_02460 n=1 Tax=Terribacillus saccharophilus TaxID=361277 RepID=A0A268HCQ0_9BACI|nr:DUF896 domain-containing protein [Terribacillus saccharophilus]MEC0304316.1 DUF896 domain-containing protein [Terribacillus saccharophilus]PAD20838.1 hypothetical protein CHH64_11685 [Terribacillus saccharophilus]PAD36599.1 hypothetical protein CHH56_01760 [Terribacillus saccharophilus]PAD97581.1 hypothetical protein CHH50_02465 [Terribacillus saccharophilus]PAE01628.1 hypothetical protein CHH48_02460 [Terribacillus saccharophilus]
MLTKDKLARLNALANKAKAEGLSLSEQKEQKELRQEYLGNVRSSFKNQFKSMTVMDREGNDVTPEKVKKLREEE